MKVIDPGHLYEVANLGGYPIATIGFVKKEQQDGAFVTVSDGTTNEEVLAVLIDRIQELNKKSPCRENSICLTHLETALLWLDKRTRDRQKRGVEGTPQVCDSRCRSVCCPSSAPASCRIGVVRQEVFIHPTPSGSGSS